MEQKKHRHLLKGLLLVGILLILFSRLLDQWLLPTFKAGLKATTPFIWGLVLAYLLRFAVNPLEKLLVRITKSKGKARWARLLSAILTLLVTVGVVVTVCVLIVPQLYDNIVRLISALPGYLQEIIAWVEQTAATLGINLSSNGENLFQTLTDQLTSMITNNSGDYIAMAGNLIIGVGTGLLDSFITVMVAFYLLVDSNRYKTLLKRTLRSIAGTEKRYKDIMTFIHQADTIMGRYINGRLIQTFILAMLSFIGFTIAGIDYAVLMGLLVGVLNLIPYIGPWIAAIPVMLLALLDSPTTAMWAGIILVALQLLDNLLLGPQILGERLKVSPLWIFVGIIIFGAMFGLPGMLLGAPATAMISILLEKFFEFREGNKDKADSSEKNKPGSKPIT